ncbi:hypothetical protein TYRP_014791 [Tyrophagus putrescentiae]|nr:hypothetical protein TYRP_014791 [Tyrophagus putrescentiae]
MGEKREKEVDMTCGIGGWQPAWLQFFASPLFFLINISLVGIIQAMTGPLYGSTMSTFEKRFGFDSRISGVILMADNFAEIALNPVVGYFSVKYNRARMVATGEVIIALSCFLTALPYFVYGHATRMLEDTSLLSKSNWTNFEMCNAPDQSPTDCSKDQGATIWPAVGILLFGSFVRGIGNTCYWVVAFPAIDDSLPKSKSPMYIAAMQCSRLIGPASGFLLSSYCLSWYENPLVDPGFSRTDPRFIGAWWLGFILVGILLILVSLPLFAFPVEIKGSSVKTADVRRRIKENGGSWGAFKRFVSNPILMLYLSVGILAGGFFISRFKPSGRTVLIFVFLVELITPLAISSGFIFDCHPLNIAGDMGKSGAFSLDTTCNAGCECSTNVYSPICGPDARTTYFSPCHGGCTKYNSLNLTFEGCSCFSGPATKGFCQSDVNTCPGLTPYMASITLGSVIASVSSTPNALIALRSVDPMDKSFSLGLASTILDLLTFIPSPLFFGFIIESACLVWETKCGKTGNCWLYDHDKFRNYLHTAAIVFILLGSVFDFAMIFFADRVKNIAQDDQEEEEGGREKG